MSLNLLYSFLSYEKNPKGLETVPMNITKANQEVYEKNPKGLETVWIDNNNLVQKMYEKNPKGLETSKDTDKEFREFSMRRTLKVWKLKQWA